MNKSGNIKEIIRRLAKDGTPTGCCICKVDSVDKEARTVDCTPLDESAPLLGVNLQANQGSSFGIVSIPKVGSYVVVGFVADGDAGVVLLTDEIESIEIVTGNISLKMDSDGVVLNDGNLGGMVKITQLTQRINAIENDINTLKNIISTWIITPQDGGAALKAALTLAWTGNVLTLTQNSDYEDTKVKH